MTAWDLFTTSTAFGARAKFVTDLITNPFGIFLAVIVCISTLAYKSSAMLDLIKLLFEKISSHSSDDHIKALGTLI